MAPLATRPATSGLSWRGNVAKLTRTPLLNQVLHAGGGVEPPALSAAAGPALVQSVFGAEVIHANALAPVCWDRGRSPSTPPVKSNEGRTISRRVGPPRCLPARCSYTVRQVAAAAGAQESAAPRQPAQAKVNQTVSLAPPSAAAKPSATAPKLQATVAPRRLRSSSPCPRSAPAAPGTCSSSSSSGGSAGFEVTELQIGGEPFDPISGSLRLRLLATLSLGADARIEAAQGFCGGLNAGVWFVRGGGADSDELVLKLVEFDRSRPANLVEADALIQLHRDRPAIANDPGVSFPLKVVRVLGVGGVRRFDLMVMRRAPGQDVATAIGEKWGSRTMVMAMMYMVGSELRELHRRYPGLQHGDCQPSNVFFDETSRRVTFIDIGGMACRTLESDVEHFTSALSKMAPYYGVDFLDCATHFTNGYNGVSH